GLRSGAGAIGGGGRGARTPAVATDAAGNLRSAGHGAHRLRGRAAARAALIALAGLRSGASLRGAPKRAEHSAEVSPTKERTPMANEKVVLVTGATGKQGGAT